MALEVSASYSWEDEAHVPWVGKLAARLRGDGADVSLDQWIERLGIPLPEFMEGRIRENERVVVICSPMNKQICSSVCQYVNEAHRRGVIEGKRVPLCLNSRNQPG